jgi:hypothetical protein
MRCLAHQGAIRIGQGLQTCREIHRVAENRDPGVSTALHLSHHRRSGVETDPQMRSDAVFDLKIGPISLQSLQDRECCATGSQRRIFECDRGAEDRHNAVAGKALYDAALLAHRVVHQLREAAHQRESGFLSRPFRERGESANRTVTCRRSASTLSPPKVEAPEVNTSPDVLRPSRCQLVHKREVPGRDRIRLSGRSGQVQTSALTISVENDPSRLSAARAVCFDLFSARGDGGTIQHHEPHLADDVASRASSIRAGADHAAPRHAERPTPKPSRWQPPSQARTPAKAARGTPMYHTNCKGRVTVRAAGSLLSDVAAVGEGVAVNLHNRTKLPPREIPRFGSTHVGGLKPSP